MEFWLFRMEIQNLKVEALQRGLPVRLRYLRSLVTRRVDTFTDHQLPKYTFLQFGLQV